MTPIFKTAAVDFELINEIGQEGRNSQVFIANDKQLDGEIVIKRMAKSEFTKYEDYFAESKIIYASKHSNIVEVKYGCFDNDFVYIAMPLYANGSLKGRMNNQHLTVRECIRYSIQILSGLNSIHSKGLLHLDIKPDNVLLSDSDEALISDFGISKYMNSYGSATIDKIYGPHITPEYVRGEDATIESDIYQFGLTLYRMLNGNAVFEAQIPHNDNELIDKVQNGTFPARGNHLYHVPPRLRRILDKCLHLDQAERYSNVLQLLNDLSEINSNLDWQFEENGDTNTWKINKSDKEFVVKTTKNGKYFDLDTEKTIFASNRTSKVRKFCNPKVASTTIKSTVQRMLKKLE